MVARHPHDTEVRDRTIVGGTHQIVERALARIDRVDGPVRLNRAGESQGEVTGARPQISDEHAGLDVQDANDRVRVPEPIGSRSPGVQPAADRSGRAVEDHVRSPADPSAARPAASIV